MTLTMTNFLNITIPKIKVKIIDYWVLLKQLLTFKTPKKMLIFGDNPVNDTFKKKNITNKKPNI